MTGMSLADALERFNRKERNLLIRDALGGPVLSQNFLKRVAEGLRAGQGIQIDVKADAWWTDYHLEWLAGALCIYKEGESALEISTRKNRYSEGEDSRLIEGNQEDIDLIIASGQDLILIEAKAFGAWGNRQLESKLVRLDLLLSEYRSIVANKQLEVVQGTRLAEPVLLASCGSAMSLYKTVEPVDGCTIVVGHDGALRYPGPIGYIERDGRASGEEPTLTSVRMMPYWDFVDPEHPTDPQLSRNPPAEQLHSGPEGRESADLIRIHLLLLSPTEPQKLKVQWPDWVARNSHVPWIPLEVPGKGTVLRVSRCDEAGNESVNTKYWRLLKNV